MSQQIEIYLHGAGTAEEKIIKVPDDATVHDVIQAAKQSGFAVDSDVIVMIEDAEEPLHADARLSDCGVKHKHHLHCHRCHKVELAVSFNGQVKTKQFLPGKRVKGVLKWAVDAFELHGVDAENKELRLGSASGTILQSQQHIGSFVYASDCHVELYLAAIVEVQG
jgi:hypothetical protein